MLWLGGGNHGIHLGEDEVAMQLLNTSYDGRAGTLLPCEGELDTTVEMFFAFCLFDR